MARIDTLQATVYDRLIARLKSALSLTDAQCYETIYPDSPGMHPPGGDYWLTVSPGNSSFPDDMQTGGGELQCTEEHDIQVTAYTRIRTDQSGHDQHVLRDATRGLWVIKQKVLKALVGHDLATTGGDTFLRGMISATYCNLPQLDDQRYVAWIGMGFSVSWDWDLES